MVGKSRTLVELYDEFCEHHTWWTSHQQDWHQVVLPDRGFGHAIVWIGVLCECEVYE
jgi:hypothetical protein